MFHVRPDKLIARQNDSTAGVGKHRHFLPRNLNFLTAKCDQRGTFFTIANADIERRRGRHVIGVGQNQMQAVLVLHDGAVTVGKQRQRFANHFYIGQVIICGHCFRLPAMFQADGKSNGNAGSQPEGPRQTR